MVEIVPPNGALPCPGVIQGLKHTVELRVISDDHLIGCVGADLQKKRQHEQKKKQVSPTSKVPVVLADVDPTVDFGVRPFDVLLELGAATTPPLLHHMRLAERWALLRYGWALEAAGKSLSPMRLSVLGQQPRYHHRALMSEDLGIGLACLICGELLAARHPKASVMRVDAEAALSSGAIPIAVSRSVTVSSTGKRPDYFFVAYDPSTATIIEVVVLECKGTHASDHVPKQLGDAMRQVRAVKVKGGGALTLQAFAAHLNGRRIKVYGVDPKGATELAGIAALRTSRRDKAEVVEHSDPDGYVINDAPRFRRRLLDVGAAQLLCWAGLTVQAHARLVGDTSSASMDVDGLERRETQVGEFIGVSSTLPIDGAERYESFFGLATDVAEALMADDDAAEAAALAAFALRTEPLRRSVRRIALDSPEDDARVSGASLDGLFLEIRKR